MPARAKVSDAEVVAAARRLIARHGAGALSMQAVGDEVGVRAPSLYKRFADRAALLTAVERQLFAELGARLEDAAGVAPPPEALRAIALAYRAFACAHPRGYELMFAADAERGPEAEAVRRAAALPVIVHGFVSMELAGAFRLGGGVDTAFALGLDMLLGAIVALHA